MVCFISVKDHQSNTLPSHKHFLQSKTKADLPVHWISLQSFVTENCCHYFRGALLCFSLDCRSELSRARNLTEILLKTITSHFKPYELKHCETVVFHHETTGKLTAYELGHKYDVSRKATSHKWFELTLSVWRGKKPKPYKKSLGNKPLPCLHIPHSEY